MFALIITLLAAEAAWQADGTRDGLEVQYRTVPGSAFLEFRVQANVAGEVSALCDGVFDWASLKKNSTEVKKRTLLEDRGDTRLVHDEHEAPIVAHRAVTFAITRSRNADGTCALESHVENEKAPTLPEGWVRLEKMQTSWRFEPIGNKTRVTFTLFVDPAGSVPAFITRGAQRNATVDTLKSAVLKAR